MAQPKRIPPAAWQEIEDALEDLQREEERILIKHGTEAAITGDATARRDLKIGIAWDQVHKAALDQMTDYKKDLAKGGSTVVVQLEDGTTTRFFTPWLKDQTTKDREEIGKLVQQHIEEGGSLGAKEGTYGYQPGSLADKLATYFDERKSQAALVARTEMSRIRNDAAWSRYKDAGVEEVEVLGGDSPCSDCDPLVGEVYPIDEAPSFPLHPNCECGLKPVIKTRAEAEA